MLQKNHTAKLVLKKQAGVSWQEWWLKEIVYFQPEIRFWLKCLASGMLVFLCFYYLQTEVFLAIAVFWLSWLRGDMPPSGTTKIKWQQLGWELRSIAKEMSDRIPWMLLSQAKRKNKLKLAREVLEQWVANKQWSYFEDPENTYIQLQTLSLKHNLVTIAGVKIGAYTIPILCASAISGKLCLVAIGASRRTRRVMKNVALQEGLIAIAFPCFMARYPILCCWLLQWRLR